MQCHTRGIYTYRRCEQLSLWLCNVVSTLSISFATVQIVYAFQLCMSSHNSFRKHVYSKLCFRYSLSLQIYVHSRIF